MKKNLLLFCLIVLSSSISMAQQTCTSAQLISAGQISIPNIFGTQLPPVSCVAGGVGGATAANWYKYTPNQDYTVTVTSNFGVNGITDNRVHIFSGICSNLVCVAGNDDNGASTLCEVIFNVVANVDYYIVFDNEWDNSGFLCELIENPIINPDSTMIGFNAVNMSTITGTYKNAVADMNGDFLDDIVAVSTNNIQIHFQDTNGTFSMSNFATTTASFSPSWSIAIGDYNDDGYNDLLYGGGSGVTFMKSDGLGTGYTQTSGTEFVFSQRSNFIDINNDGHLDAFVCHDVDPNVYYINDGTGNLTFNQGGLGDHPDGGNYGSIWVDYNNDQLPDLFIAKCRGGVNTAKINELHKNNGNGTFTNVAAQANMADPVQTWSSAWNDYDNDGWMDAVVGASSTADGSHKFMHNNGDGTFSDITAGSGLDTYNGLSTEYVSYDFNNDGFTDVLTNNTILFNNGNNTFTATSFPITVGPVGDLNNDGFLDIQNGVNIHYNTGNSLNWITVSTEGITSNRNGIGARVEIYGSWGKQIRDIRSGVGFRNMGTLNAHFGIGTATSIDSLIVRWPSGAVDVICNPAINTAIHVTEDSGPVPFASFTTSASIINELDTVSFTDVSSPCPLSWNWTVIPSSGWQFVNGSNSNSQNPAINFTIPGTYIVSQTSTNSNGTSINISSDTIQVNNTMGFRTNDCSGLLVYPNPAENLMYVKVNHGTIRRVNIVSVIGETSSLNFNTNDASIDVSSLASGTYFLTVITDTDQIINSRFVKK